jgi:MFS transporter, ACS family, tartrate transporter
MDQVDERAVMRKIFFRLVPLLMALYVVAYVDRVNVGFAALTMNKDLMLSPAIYGMGAGIFFIGYTLFAVPGNIMMVRLGARRWLARIVFVWGFFASAMALVQGQNSFLAIRFLLGVAEAGLFPAMVIYLTYWFPARYLARIMAICSLAIPIALAVGAPVSTAIMGLDGHLGLKGWQWLFLLEGLPAIAMTFAVLKGLPDEPASSLWLTARERAWVKDELLKDLGMGAASAARDDKLSVWRVFTHPAILALGFMYFCTTSTNLGLSLFLPQIVKEQGFTTMQTGFISAVPYIFGCVGMVTIGYLSDLFNERKGHVIASFLIAAAGLGLAGWLGSSVGSIAALCFATVGILGIKGPFWPLPSLYVTGANAAVAIAFINSLGGLGGFVGPSLVGIAKQYTHNFQSGLYLLAGMALMAAAVALLCLDAPRSRS